jgi:uncharacterized protein YlaI
MSKFIKDLNIHRANTVLKVVCEICNSEMVCIDTDTTPSDNYPIHTWKCKKCGIEFKKKANETKRR